MVGYLIKVRFHCNQPAKPHRRLNTVGLDLYRLYHCTTPQDGEDIFVGAKIYGHSQYLLQYIFMLFFLSHFFELVSIQLVKTGDLFIRKNETYDRNEARFGDDPVS